jgi:carbonic anhydrase/acetyltransferase-like protein (isoleucine patch superfamily)
MPMEREWRALLRKTAFTMTMQSSSMAMALPSAMTCNPNNCLIGPNAHVVGCRIEDQVFIATGAAARPT